MSRTVEHDRVRSVLRGDPLGEGFRLHGERIGSLLEQQQSFQLSDALVARGSIEMHHDGLGRGRVDDRIQIRC